MQFLLCQSEMFALLLTIHCALMHVYLHIEIVHGRFFDVKNVDSVYHFVISLELSIQFNCEKVHCRRHIKKVLS